MYEVSDAGQFRVRFLNLKTNVSYTTLRTDVNKNPDHYFNVFDVLLSKGRPKWWEFWIIPFWLLLKRHQSKLFLGNKFSWDFSHVILYIGQGWFFEVTMPHARLVHVSQLKFYNKGYAYLYRFRHKLQIDYGLLQSWGRYFVAEARRRRRWYYPWTYDVLSLLKIYLCRILGYKDLRVPRLLQRIDMGYWMMTCSVGSRAFVETMYQKHEIGRCRQRPGKLLYYNFNGGKGVDVELTTPAHPANSPEDYG